MKNENVTQKPVDEPPIPPIKKLIKWIKRLIGSK